MKTYYFMPVVSACLVAGIVSCKDNGVIQNELPESPQGNVLLEPHCCVEPFTPLSDPHEVEEDFPMDGSRSQLILGNSGMDFVWDDNDNLVVYGKEMAAEIYMNYNIKSHDENGNALFNIGELPMKANTCYLAFGQRENLDNPDHVRLTDRDHITVNYAGQKQVGNKTTGHLGAFDYIAAAAVADENGIASFRFQHLGTTLSLIFQDFENYKIGDTSYRPDSILWTSVQLYSDDNDYLQPVRTLNLRNGLPAEGADGYAPALNSIDMSADENRNADRFKIELRAHTDEDCPNKVDGKCNCGVGLMTDNGKSRLRVFMEVPPFEFSGTKRFIFRLTGYDPNNHDHPGQRVNYYYIYEKSTPIRAGKAVQMTMTPLPTSDFDLKVKLHLDWHNKSVYNHDASRAVTIDEIGDPGDKEGFVPPSYLYAWIFDGNTGKLIYKKLFGPSDLDGKWNQDLNDAYIYTGNFNFQFSIDSQTDFCNVYIATSTFDLGSAYWAGGKSESDYNTLVSDYIASHGPLVESKESHYTAYVTARDALAYGTVNTTDVDDIKGLTYDLPGDIQAIRNIWSTPYDEDADAFVGKVYNGMNINLHHVAAKIDMQWNCAYPVHSATLLGLQTTGLKIFTPTENDPVYPTGGTDLVFNMTPDKQYNGRQVFYIPQPRPMTDAEMESLISASPGLAPLQLYKGQTILFLTTQREAANGDLRAPVMSPMPFPTSGVLPSWFRANANLND